MRFLPLTLLLALAPHLFADYSYNATRITCSSQVGTLFLRLDPQSNDIRHITYVDQQTTWLAHAIMKDNLDYSVGVFRAESLASGEMPANLLTHLTFSLPQRRSVRRVMSGYGGHDHEDIPAQFKINLETVRKPNLKSDPIELSCTGW